jgi:hypothetical protein
MYTANLSLHVCIDVCEWVSERERQTDGQRENYFNHNFFLWMNSPATASERQENLNSCSNSVGAKLNLAWARPSSEQNKGTALCP